MKKTERVIEVMPGCKIFQAPEAQIMFGCPSEIIKVLAQQGRSVPSIIVLPTDFVRFGTVQAALEFCLDDFLFIKEEFHKGKRLLILGTAEQIKRMRTILRITVLGPSKEETKTWGIPKAERTRFHKVQEHMVLKNLDNSPVTIDDLVEFIEFRDELLYIADAEIKPVGRNVFKVVCQEEESFINIDLTEAQKPPLPIETAATLPNRSVLGATSLSKCTTGFDAAGYTSGLILWLNGLGVSVDGVAWMKAHLRALGINPSEIRAHILTHIHDDHSNILDMIINGEKTVIITAKIVYRSFILKVANLLGIPAKEVEKLVKFVRVVPGRKFQWHGATFEFWYSVHSIPTIGFRVSVASKSIVYSGDTLWGTKLDELKAEKTIDKQQYETVSNIPNMASELTFFDAGGGTIHPSVGELAVLPEQDRMHMVLTHTSSLTSELEKKFTLAEAGQSWEIIGQQILNASDLMAIMRSPLLLGMGPDWMSVVISQGKIREYAAKEILLKEGQPGTNFFVLLGGTVSVLYGKDEITQLATGDFFGEISLMKRVPCTATIKTRTPVKTLELSRDIFLEMVSSTKLAGKLMRIHQIRPILIRFSLLCNLDAPTLNELIGAAQTKRFKKGEIIVKEGEKGTAFYGIIKGKVSVTTSVDGERQPLATLYSNQFFGEIALLGNGVRTADVVAATEVELFIIYKQDFDKIVGGTPRLHYELGLMASKRRKRRPH